MKIQILLAAYNGARYIEPQLDSLIAQQHGVNDRYEILISDDGSTDGTYEILTEYQERYPSLVRVLELSHSGSAIFSGCYRSRMET